jgi:hypothetical protein
MSLDKFKPSQDIDDDFNRENHRVETEYSVHSAKVRSVMAEREQEKSRRHRNVLSTSIVNVKKN